MTEKTDSDISSLYKDLDKAINKRKWSTIRQRTLPMIARPAATGAALFAGLAASWQYLEPIAQKFAVMGSASLIVAGTAASLIAPLFNKKSTPFVSKNDAAILIDNDLNDRSKPTQTLRDKTANYSPEGADQILNLDILRIWKKWSDPISNQKFELGHSPYYTNNTSRTVLHTGAIAAAVSAALMTNVTLQDFNEAMWYQPPPPELVYSAWLTPPDGVPSAPLYQNNMLQRALEEGQSEDLSAHEGSIFSIVTYDRQGEIVVNGNAIQPDTLDNDQEEQNDTISEFRYNIPLNEGEIQISIEGHSFVFDITPDDAPNIDILSSQIDPEAPGNVIIEYVSEDDFGVTGADLNIGITNENGDFIEPLVPSLEIPTISIPHSDRPDGP